ncbi:MAG: response regulator [Oligoflexia bacterium]|nr:response regulator [Oligoflexia bacterium]
MRGELAQCRVLIADDLATVRKVLRKLLAEIGLSLVDEASDGEQALKKIQSEQFDLVICDWEMPRLTGIQLVQQLRALPQYAALPFILITAHNTKEAVIQAAEAGVSMYISKPFTVETLRQKIQASLAKQESSQP